MNKRSTLKLVLGFGVVVLLAALATALYFRSMAAHDPRIVDNAGALSGAEISMLGDVLDLVERASSTRIAIVLVPSLQGEALDEYGARFAQAWWKVHLWKPDARVLMLISVDDGQVYWDVGKGLQTVLPESAVTRIVDEDMQPYLREGKIDDALYSALESLFSQITLARTEVDWPFLHRAFDRPSDATGFLVYGLLLLLAILSLYKMVAWGRQHDRQERAHDHRSGKLQSKRPE
jgi:uncharacterized membrane protein YgcG